MQQLTTVYLTRTEYESITPDAATLYNVDDSGVVTQYLGSVQVDAASLTPELAASLVSTVSGFADVAGAASTSAKAAQIAAETAVGAVASDAEGAAQARDAAVAAAASVTQQKGLAGGIAPLDSSAKVPLANLPELGTSTDVQLNGTSITVDGVANIVTGQANGIAPLDASSKVPTANLPGVPLTGTTDPTTATAGTAGQLYVNTATPKLFVCYGNDGTDAEPSYIWKSYIPTSDKGAANGVCNLNASSKVPVARLNTNANYGIIGELEQLRLSLISNAGVDNRSDTNNRKAITPSVLDYAVRSVSPNVTTIPAATTAYSLLDASATTNSHSWNYRHAPTSAPTYTLPAVTSNPLVREIVLEVTFTGYVRSSDDDSGSAYAWKNGTSLLYTDTTTPTAGTTVAYTDTALTTSAGTIAAYDPTASAISLVASCEFVDSGGTAIVPRPMSGTISAGTIVQYLCEWSAGAGAWIIYPLVVREGVNS